MSKVSITGLYLMANDVSATQAVNSTYWNGGRGTFIVEGTAFGGGSVTLQYQSPNGTFITVGAEGVMTANGMAGFELPPGFLRAERVTATGVHAWVIGSLIGGP